MSEQSIIDATHKWLSSNFGRSVEVRSHTNGWRVSLKEDYEEVGFGVRKTLNASLEDAFSSEPKVRQAVLRRQVESLEDLVRQDEDACQPQEGTGKNGK
jgi:hypothetical protein